MDKSIAWWRDASGMQPWIVDRPNQATENGVPKVIVTSSLLLTLSINDYNAMNVDPAHPVLDRCAIAFMLDWDGGTRTFRQIEAPLPCPDPIVVSVRWLYGFAPFPPNSP